MRIFDALETVLRSRYAARSEPADLLVITGDVFDSATLPLREATQAFVALHERLVDALGGKARTVIVPGNHDRRQKGLLGPHRLELFVALKAALGRRAYVHGCDTPFLAAVVPRDVHGLPLSIIAYDSTYLPSGLVSAGGVIRQEDLLHAAVQLEGEPADEPVLFLVHHHLVPTPLTDLGAIDVGSAAGLVKWAVQRVLPGLVANADREELMMTALGAGTALSTLHELGRAVLVLHGHKHYATARMLRGMLRSQGDVLVVSAGSTGIAEPWSPTSGGDPARLWPSFNAMTLDEGALSVDTIAFGYKGSSTAKPVVRELVRARHEREQWTVSPVALEPRKDVGPHLSHNHSDCFLRPSSWQKERWDYTCKRRIHSHGHKPRRYVEIIEGIAGSKLSDGPRRAPRATTSREIVELAIGGETSYRLEGGVCRTIAESERIYGPRSSPYEWLGLMNRYHCDDARLSVAGLGESARGAFASATDLGTGIEQPLKLVREEGTDRVEAVMASCPARTLLRVYWPLSR